MIDPATQPGPSTRAPEAIARAFQETGIDPGRMAAVAKPGPPSPIQRFQGMGLALAVAIEPEGQRQNLLEAAGRHWASAQGVPVPCVVAADPDGRWLLAQLVPVIPPGGEPYVRQALAAADAVAAADPPNLPVAPSRWRAERPNAAGRAARLLAGGLRPDTFLLARRAAGELPASITCHGDLYRRNVLCTAGPQVYVVDWEFLGPGAEFTDHLRFWSTLLDPADRTIAWSATVDRAGEAKRGDLLVLARWLVIRLLAENLDAPTRQRNRADLRHARAMQAELRANEAALRPRRRR